MIPETGQRAEFKDAVLDCNLDGPQPGERYFIKTPMITGTFDAPTPRKNMPMTIHGAGSFISFVGSDFIVEHAMWEEWAQFGWVKFLGYDP